MSEFDEFEKLAPITPPRAVSEQIIARVRAELDPSTWQVFAKLSLIHLGTALLTLSICPQFGFRLFGEGMGLMGYFMSFGDLACAATCGFFFLSSSLLVAALVLRGPEIRALRRHRFAELLALTGLSLGFFLMRAPSEIVLGFTAAWAAGSILGGWLTLELAWVLNRRAAREA